MRALIALCVVAAMVAGASAAACTPIPSGNIYDNSAACTSYNMCGSTFCGCVGSMHTNPNMCLGTAANGTTCTKIESCLKAYSECIEHVPASATGCNALNMTLKIAYLAAASSGYANSTLQRSCQNRVCAIMNGTTSTCDFGVNQSNVCMWRPMPVATTTPAPTQFAVVAYIGEIVLSGSAWGGILAAAETAICSDLAGLLQIEVRHIHCVASLGSLRVRFQVSAAAGVQPATLQARAQLATANTNWLTSSKTLYATVSSETIGVTSVTTLQTAAPGLVTPAPPTTTTTPAPTPTPSSISASTSTIVSAAFVAAAAVLAMF